MNLFISCDMEGTAGVCSWNQCDPSNTSEYPVYRRYMTQEVRAAIEGAREGGVDRVLVNDSHWSMRNLLFDELPADDDLRVISGTRKPWSMAQGIDSGVDGAFFTGYHAKAGDSATLAHTFSSEVYAVTINGIACSEAVLNAALAGSYGVPMLLVTGDRTIVDECIGAMPWIVGVCVKDPIGYTAVDSLTPAAAQAAIRAGAREAIERKERAKPFVLDPPYEMIVETAEVEQSEFIELMPGFVRIGGRATSFRAQTFPLVMQAFVAATRMAAAANPIA